MSFEQNKFAELFADAESSNDVRTIYFENCDGLSEQDLASLREAHEAAYDRVFKDEFEVMRRLVGVR